MFYFICHGRLKRLETNMCKKPHYLIGQLEILSHDLISQNAIVHETRWMLTSNSLSKFPLVHQLILCGLFERILHGFWLKILCETIADVNHNFSPSWKDRCMIFSKPFHVKTRKTLDCHANSAWIYFKNSVRYFCNYEQLPPILCQYEFVWEKFEVSLIPS